MLPTKPLDRVQPTGACRFLRVSFFGLVSQGIQKAARSRFPQKAHEPRLASTQPFGEVKPGDLRVPPELKEAGPGRRGGGGNQRCQWQRNFQQNLVGVVHSLKGYGS